MVNARMVGALLPSVRHTSENRMKRRDLENSFDRHIDDVYSYVAYRVAPDREAARDIAQEVFLAALKGLAKFRGNDDGARHWLRGIARHKVADHFRARFPHVDRDALGIGVPDQTATQTPGDRQRRALMVSWVMRQLPGRYADLLEDKYLEGLSVRAIARQRETTEKAVESALSRARDAFRAIYRRSHDDWETNDEI